MIKKEVCEDYEIYFSVYKDKFSELLIIKSLYNDDRQGVISLEYNENSEIIDYNLILNLENRIFISGLKLQDNNKPLFYLYTYNYSLGKYGLFDVNNKFFVIDEVSNDMINIDENYNIIYDEGCTIKKISLKENKNVKIREKEV